jgi:hypothetical protein
LWQVYPSRGQDTPESGLAAIACAASMALLGKKTCTAEDIRAAEAGTLPSKESQATKVFDSHWMIYVSDAPARNSEFSFESMRLGQSLHDLSDRILKSGAELRFYAASKNDRKGLLPLWPIPLTQLQEITSLGSIPFQEMKFPVTADNVDETFISQARTIPDELKEHRCIVEELGQISEEGVKFNVMRAKEEGGAPLYFRPIQGIGLESDSEVSKSTFYVQRKCSGEMRTFEKFPIESF